MSNKFSGTAKAKKGDSLIHPGDRNRAGTFKIKKDTDNYLTMQTSGNKSMRETTIDGGSNYTNDDFDEVSMSKSVRGMGQGILGKKQENSNIKVNKRIPESAKSMSSRGEDNYDDDFESISASQSLATQSFKIKTKIDMKKCPKCGLSFSTKVFIQHFTGCKDKGSNERSRGKFTNYSPIKETVDERGLEESKDSSTAKKDITASYNSDADFTGSGSKGGMRNKLHSSGKKYDSSGFDSSGNSQEMMTQSLIKKQLLREHGLTVSGGVDASASRGLADSSTTYDD